MLFILKLGDFAPIICGKFGLQLPTMYSCPLITLQRAEYEHRPEVASSPTPSRGEGPGDEAEVAMNIHYIAHFLTETGQVKY